MSHMGIQAIEYSVCLLSLFLYIATQYCDVLLLLLLLLLLDVVPDILTIGKPMGNGFPVSGLVTTPTVDTLHAKKAPPHYSSVSGVCTYLCLCTSKYYNIQWGGG